MKLRSINFGLALTSSALCLLAASAATVTYTDLNPSGATYSYVNACNGTEQAGLAVIGGHARALLWRGTAGSVVDLHPGGASGSDVAALSATNQIGAATFGPFNHACMWSGSAGSFLDLHPDALAPASNAQAASSTHQGGFLWWYGDRVHAAIWSGSAGSCVDIHPPCATNSMLYGMSDSQQVGYITTNGTMRAALWLGTAASFVDLHPTGADWSYAAAASGSQQAGVANFGGTNHAAMWSGTSVSFVDMHPTEANSSGISGLTDSQQAGFVNVLGTNHAALWSAESTSYVNLGTVLGSNYVNSYAYGIWGNGRVTYVVGYAGTKSGETHAILWTIKEPVSLKMLPGNLAGIVIDDAVGAKYRLDSKTNLSDSSWLTLTNVTLPTQPYTFIDYDSPGLLKRFYRAVPQ